MRRYKHSLSHYKLASFSMGNLVPVGLIDVLPGDSIRMSTSVLLRLQALAAPVMHPVSVRIHHFFVPFRILWPRESAEIGGWEEFITGGRDGEGDGAVYPVITGEVAGNSLFDFMGVPPVVGLSQTLSALPIRAYNMIYNEYYRDQDLIEPVDEDFTEIQNVAWEKDIFTAARPWAQKGPEVTLPLGTTAPVVANLTTPGVTDTPAFRGPFTGGPTQEDFLRGVTGSPNAQFSGNAAATTSLRWGVLGAGTGLLADLSDASAVDVNTVRLAFALQRYQEARAQFGSRYTEYLRYLGIRSSDARLQRPEYLGGGRSTVSFSEVLRTSNAATMADPPEDYPSVGEMNGHGIAALRTRPFVRFFEEHGVILSLASVRPRSMYADGVHRSWLKRTKEDYFQKELESVGQQSVQYREVYAEHATPEGDFGWQDRYYEYRHQPSNVTSLFRTVYNDWHLARLFSSDPALNADFINCDPGQRIFADQNFANLLGMFSHSVQARRMVGNRTIGRIF